METNSKWTENVIVADADYLDAVAFNLIVNFERMLERRIPQADLARWAECAALDGGLRGEGNQVMVVLLREKGTKRMENFQPSDLTTDVDGKAFQGALGEFTFSVVSTEEVASKKQLTTDILSLVSSQQEVKRLMVVPADTLLNDVHPLLNRLDSEERRTTLFTMQPARGGAFRQELLGYSLMAALGINADEIDKKLNAV